MKVCCTCRQDKDLSHFGKNKNTKDGLSVQCRVCAKEYRETHKEEKKKYPSSTLEYKHQYYNDNKDEINEMRRENRRENVVVLREQSSKSHIRNREARLVVQRTYYENNIEYFRTKNKTYSENNKEAILLKNRKRKEKILCDNITQNQVEELLLSHNNKCFYCHVDVKSGINLHLDHMIPLCKGGVHSIDNLTPACNTCNLKKGRMTADEFLKRKEQDDN